MVSVFGVELMTLEVVQDLVDKVLEHVVPGWGRMMLCEQGLLHALKISHPSYNKLRFQQVECVFSVRGGKYSVFAFDACHPEVYGGSEIL